jgi:hypothetical protein
MTPRKLNVMFCFFCYTGNSTGTSVVWPVASWWAQTAVKLKTDDYFKDRIEAFWEYEISDTPITMTRNRVIEVARKQGADILVMVDSDMHPDVHLKDDPFAKPFFETAFKEIYEHYDAGPLVIGAPYGGAPPHENMFVFTWSAKANMGDESAFELRQYTREEAQEMLGLQECAALPTGLIAYDMRVFDCIEKPYFQYEWSDDSASQKASTEDVQNTRDLSLGCIRKHGYNPLRCAWSSWAGHYKVWCVKRPRKYTADDVSRNLANAVTRGLRRDERYVDLSKGWEKEISTAVHVRPRKDRLPLPADFPYEILNGMSEDDWDGLLATRMLFGHQVVSWGHQTSIEHLNSLRQLAVGFEEQHGRKPHYLEIGSWVGESAVAMADVCQSRFCVDTWKGSTTDQTREFAKAIDIKKLFDFNTRHNRPGVYLDTSLNVAKVYSRGKKKHYFDIILIDADHSYESTKQDIELWRERLSPEGILVGHDYGTDQFPGVTKAVVEIFGSNFRPYGITDQGGFWLYRQEAA